MEIITMDKCIKINSMAWVHSLTVRQLKKGFSDMESFYLEPSPSTMELFIKALWKMGKNQAKEFFKEQMAFTTLDISNTINLMEMAKFITLISQITKELFKKAYKTEKAV